MEEENGEANKIKEKKQKRGEICSPETQIYTAENGSQAKVKKERKKVEMVAKEKEDETDQKKDTKKTKRKKHDGVSSTIETDDSDKRKKKSTGNGVIQAENITLKAEKLEKKRKNEKLKDKCVQTKPDRLLLKVEEDKEMQMGSNNCKKPKKGKGKVLVSRTAETKEVIVEKKKKTPVITNGVGKTKAKKKAKVLENGIKVAKEETEVSKVKLKRKKEKESKCEGFGNEINAKRKRLTEDKEILPKKKNKLKNKEIAAEEDVSEIKIKKSKKVKEEDGKIEAEEMEPQKKKKKRVKEDEGVEDNIALAAEPQSKKSKKKQNSTEDGQDVKTEAKATGKKKKNSTEDGQDVKTEAKATRKKKKNSTEDGQDVKTEAKATGKKKQNSTEDGQDVKTEAKATGKKKKNSTEDGQDVKTEAKATRKKKKNSTEDGQDVKTEAKATRKKKKNSTEDGQDVKTEVKATGKKKMKNNKEQEDSQDFPKSDVVFLSAKPGNSDEVAINQERRKALQMEIEEASQPHKPDKPTALGQWSTAQFDSSQQQQKFLRLMGGFKKGFQPAGTANMALGKDAQHHLQQGLLGEFERAHARKMDFSNRGAGLGFTAPSNKKFLIDVNASRSVRFDD